MSADRPSWMEGGARRPKQPARPYTLPDEHRQSSSWERSQPRYTTHPNVVAGITILACFALFNAYFWLGIGLINAINPPDTITTGSGFDRVELSPTLADYLTAGRVVVATLLGLIGTAITWSLVRGFYEQG